MGVKGLNDCRWPLFCGDLNLAQDWVRGLLERSSVDRAQAAHWALSVGLQREVRDLLDNPVERERLKHAAAGLHFRLLRAGGEPNPYRVLLTGPSETACWVQLMGGIGDCLEDLAKLATPERGRLQLHCSHQRIEQLKPLLPQARWSSNLPPGEISVPAKAILAGMGSRQPRPTAFLSQQPTQQEQPPRWKILCCWRAEGLADAFSAWSRSIPFHLVLEQYRRLIQHGWQAETIADITAWKPWERQVLQNLGVIQMDPSMGNVLDLAEAVNTATHVVSIDTALAHLCAVMGKDVHLMLPLFSDERWHELLQAGSCYAKHCKVHRQSTFGCWRSPLEEVLLITKI